MKKDFDIAIIGGGPAGSSAGAGLAKAGFRVCIIEARTFPRIKVCGEYISPAATEILERLLPRAELLKAGARSVHEIVICAGTRRVVWETPRSAWAVSRASLDTMLLEKAGLAGAALIQPRVVRGVTYDKEGAVITLTHDSAIRADLVIHADGIGRHDPHGAVPMAPGLLGCKCHFRAGAGVVQGVTMRACRGAYVGTIAVDGGEATCALTVRRSLVADFRGDLDRMLLALWPGFKPEWRTSDWKTCGVQRSGYVSSGHIRSLRIGNAAAAVDPIGGEGIGLALWAGSRVAALLSGSRELKPDQIAACEHRLGSEYRSRLRMRLPVCRATAEVLMHPGVLGTIWPLLHAPGLTLRPWYRLSGKPA